MEKITVMQDNHAGVVDSTGRKLKAFEHIHKKRVLLPVVKYHSETDKYNINRYYWPIRVASDYQGDGNPYRCRLCGTMVYGRGRNAHFYKHKHGDRIFKMPKLPIKPPPRPPGRPKHMTCLERKAAGLKPIRLINFDDVSTKHTRRIYQDNNKLTVETL